MDRVKQLIASARAFPDNHPVISAAVPGALGGVALAAYQNASTSTPALTLTQEVEHPDLMVGKSAALRVGHVLGGVGAAVGAHDLTDYALTLKNEADLDDSLQGLRHQFRQALLDEQAQAMRFNNPHKTTAEPSRVPVRAPIDLSAYQQRPVTMKAAGVDSGMKYPVVKLINKIKERLADLGGADSPIPGLVAGGALAGGLGLGALEGYRRSASADSNRALLDSVKLDQATRLGPTGRIPIQVRLGSDPSLQPLGAGARALVDPNRGSDVFNLL